MIRGGYSIENTPLYETLGCIVESGGDDLLKIPETKGRYTHDWADQNGTEVDQVAPIVFKPRTISLSVVLFANGEVDFWNKYKSLFTILSSGPNLRLYSAELDRSFYVCFTSSTSIDRLTRIKDTPLVSARFNLSFIEYSPNFWTRFTYLTDENGREIVINLNKKIIV